MPEIPEGTPEEQRKEIIRKHYSEMGKKGSKNKWAKISKKQRSKIMSDVVKARWAKRKKENV